MLIHREIAASLFRRDLLFCRACDRVLLSLPPSDDFAEKGVNEGEIESVSFPLDFFSLVRKRGEIGCLCEEDNNGT